MSAALAGTGASIRLVLRRDRIRATVWVLGVAALVLSAAASQVSIYATEAERASYAAAMGANPAVLAMSGPGYALDTLGGIVAFETGVTGYLALALMGVLLVVRHTRAEEESGRTELLRAGRLGRHAGLTAASCVVGALGVLASGVIGAGLVLLGLPVGGSVAMAASFASVALVFTAIGAVAAQLTTTARGASGIGVAVLGAAFVLRAAGDAGGTWLSWLSPIGWAQALRPFADERWTVLVLPLATTGVLLAVAVALSSRRDVGAGLLATRGGPATASARLSGPLGLAVRLQRASLIAWCSGLFVLGLAYGSVGESVEQLAADNDAMAELIAASGTDVVDAFFVVAATMLALIVGGLGLQSALRLRAEESAGRAEPLLATATSRQAVLGAHVLVAVVGSTVGLACAGVGLGTSHALLTGDAAQLPRLAAAVLAQAPAVWVLVGLAAALFGLLPRATPLVWAALAASVVIALLGEPLRLPDSVRDLSPYTHVPQLPEQTMSWPPLLALTVCSALLAAAGTWAFTRRDVG